MYAVLAFEIAVGKIALHIDCAGLDAGFVAIEKVGYACLVAVLLAPAQIHAHKHRGPVLALGTAGSGIDFKHDAELILLAAQHIAQLEVLDYPYGRGIQFVKFMLLHEALLDHIPAYFQFSACIFDIAVAVKPLLYVLDFLHLRLCFLGMLPEIRHMRAQFLFFYLDFLAVDVKDTSSAPACAQKSLLIVPV